MRSDTRNAGPGPSHAGDGAAMSCDTSSGACAAPTMDPPHQADPLAPARTTATAIYVTDPICSGCWALEPAWRKLAHRHREILSVRHVYGGLLPAWEGFADRGAGISAPADVAPHWAEVAERSGQAINPTVWESDPPSSSYPPSKAAHVVRMLDPSSEEPFLRRIREAIFVEARNIARPEVLVACAEDVGIDARAFTTLLEADAGARGLDSDLSEARALGVRVFPTLIFSGAGSSVTLAGTHPFHQLESALLTAAGAAAEQRVTPPSAGVALRAYGAGTLLEFAELLELAPLRAEAQLTAAGASRRRFGAVEYWSAKDHWSARKAG